MRPADLVPQIHAAPVQAVLAITGGGSGAIERLLTTPGASATVLEARVPYAPAALAEWLGEVPEQSCSEQTARRMAMVAFQRARALAASDISPHHLVGIGCTAGLVTSRPRRGEHRVHVAAQTSRRTVTLKLLLEKGSRTRAEEEAIASHAVIALLADVGGIRSIDLTKTPSGIEPTLDSIEAPEEWSELLLGQRQAVKVNNVTNPPCLLMPGSFNPLHEGHQQMMHLAEKQTGHTAIYELSLTNVDKAPLDFKEIKQRIEGIAGRPLLLTDAPTFVEKARLFPNCTFVVGADTALRIGNPLYYGNNPGERDKAIDEISQLGCQFLVFGREAEEAFQELTDLGLPPELLALCDGVSADEFRCDLSSTKIRRRS